jgi:hypothetical protein
MDYETLELKVLEHERRLCDLEHFADLLIKGVEPKAACEIVKNSYLARIVKENTGSPPEGDNSDETNLQEKTHELYRPHQPR